MFTAWAITVLLVAVFFHVLMYGVDWWLYKTDALYRAEFGRPSFLPWKTGYRR